MRILVLGINYWPEETGIGVFNTGRCEYLASRGDDVTMCTAFPFYPRWRLPGEYRRRLFTSEAHNGVTILRSRLYVPSRATTLKRVLHEASFIAGSCLRAMTSRRPDLLLTISPPLGLAASSIWLSKLWRVPFVFHVADLQPDAALDLGMLPRGRVIRGLYALERLAYRKAALVSTLNEPMRRRVIAKGIPAEKVALLPDWADPAFFELPVAAGERFRREFGLENRFLMVHVGNMGVKQGLEVILGAAELSANDPDLIYLLVGDGAVRSSLESRARDLGLKNIIFLPLQPKRVFLDLLAASDLCFVTQQAAVADIVFPSKVMTILAAGRPVVASVSGSSQVARLVRQVGAGLVVEPESPSALVEAVCRLRRDRPLRIAMGERGRACARERWDRESILPRMESYLRRLGDRGDDGGASRGAARKVA